MTKEEFVSIITRKIDEAYDLSEQAKKDIIFYTALNGENCDEVIKARKQIEYAKKIIKELKDIVMLPIYERIQYMSNDEIEKYRIKEINYIKKHIIFYNERIEKYEKQIEEYHNDIVKLKAKYMYEMPVSYNKEILCQVKELQDKIDDNSKEISYYKTMIGKFEEKLAFYEKASKSELIQSLVEDLCLVEMKTISEQKNSNEVDKIMVKLKNKPELASELQSALQEYFEIENTELVECINCNITIEDLPQFNSILNGTKVSKMDELGNLSVYNSHDFSIIKNNIETVIKRVTEVCTEIEGLKNIISEIDLIYCNSDKTFKQEPENIGEKLLLGIKNLYKKLNIESKNLWNDEPLELIGLEQLIERYKELSKKTFKTNSIIEEKVELKYAIKTSLIEILTELIAVVCKKIKSCFNIVNKDQYDTGVFYLEFEKNQKYNIPYDRVDITALIHFVNRYMSNILYYRKELYDLLYKCGEKELKLKEKEDGHKEHKINCFDKIQKIYQELINDGSLIHPCCFEKLLERINNNEYIDSQVNLEKQNTIDEIKQNTYQVDMIDSEELTKMKNILLDYLNNNSHKFK